MERIGFMLEEEAINKRNWKGLFSPEEKENPMESFFENLINKIKQL